MNFQQSEEMTDSSPLLLLVRRVCVAPDSTQRFVRRRGDQVGVVKRRGDGFGGNQAADVSHVSEQVGVDVGAELQWERGGRRLGQEMKVSGTMFIFPPL